MPLAVKLYGVARIASVLIAGGCVGATAPAPSEEALVRRGIAADVGEAIASAVAPKGAVGAGSAAALVGLADPQAAGAACVRGSSGWFSCPPFVVGGITVRRSFRYWRGTAVASSLSAAIDSITRTRAIVGSFTRGSGKQVWIDRVDTLTVHMIPQAKVRTIDGAGRRTDSSLSVAHGTTTHLAHVARDTVYGLTIARDRVAQPWPLAGTVISAMITTARVSDAKGERRYENLAHRVVVAFSGARVVPLRVGDVSCALDLQSHHVFNCR
ncbi:MAG: hypothetical protein NVS1B4_21650 [Gemmatimonadaceae bacterium]